MKNCFNCGKPGFTMYGYIICDSCKTALRLYKKNTIEKYYSSDPARFEQDIQDRLIKVEKDYIKKRIKLLHVQEQLDRF